MDEPLCLSRSRRTATRMDKGGATFLAFLRPTSVMVAPVLAIATALPLSLTAPQLTGTSPLTVPTDNMGRTQAVQRACTDGSSTACQKAVLRAINGARRAEGTKRLNLPANYSRLKVPQQLLVLAHLERVDRGLPGFTGLSMKLDKLARQAALSRTRPIVPSTASWGSNWASGEASALLATFDWMYNDKPGSPNLECCSENMTGCWGHRLNILGHYGPHPSMGAAFTIVDGVTSLTELFSSSPAGPLHYRLPRISAVPARGH